MAAARKQEAQAGLVELVRAERASTRFVDRVRASIGLSLKVHVGFLPGEPESVLAGELVDAGGDWLLLAEGAGGRQALVPIAAVDAIAGLAPHIVPEKGFLKARLGLPHALRALARDRVEVAVSSEARTFVGRLDRVGADHVDVAPAAGPPWSVPIAALRVVRSR